MNLSYATTELLDFLDTLPTVGSRLPQAQRHALTVFADGAVALSTAETSHALNIIATLLKNEHISVKIVELYRPLVLDLVARWLAADSLSMMDTDSNALQDLESMARAFALILPIVPQATRYVSQKLKKMRDNYTARANLRYCFLATSSFAVRLFSNAPSPLEWLNTLTGNDLTSPSPVCVHVSRLTLDTI